MRLLKGLGSLAVMVFVLVGIPALLWLLGGNPLPTELPSTDLLTKPTDIGLFLSVVTFVGWLAWATLAWAILVEIYAALRGVTIRPPKALAWQHGSARSLVGGVMLLGALGSQIGGTAIAGATPATGPESTGTQYVADRDSTRYSTSTTEASPIASMPAKPPKPLTITTERGDTLWDLAETHLGDGHRWTEIRDLNPDSAGSVFLPVGAKLSLPPTVTAAAPGQATVVEGDCLWDLAKTHLGDPYRWTEIRDANPDTVHGHGSLVYIGSHLTIPGAAHAPDESASVSEENPSPLNAAPPVGEDSAPPTEAKVPESGEGRHAESVPTTSAAPSPEFSVPSSAESSVPSSAESSVPSSGEGSSPSAQLRVPESGEGRHAESVPTTPAAPSPEFSVPSSAESSVPSSPEEKTPGRGEVGRHTDTDPAASSSVPVTPPSSPAPAPASVSPGDDGLAQSAEDQVARILGSFGADGLDSQSQELPPPPPPVVDPPSTAPSPPPLTPAPVPTPAVDSSAIELTPVEPQVEAAPGSAEAEKIAEQAAAAAAEYGLGAARVVEPSNVAASAPAAQSTVVAGDPVQASTSLDGRTSRIAGLSAVALLGMISVIQVYRRRQQHDRRRGEAIALPLDDAGEVLTEANAAVDPVVLADVDLVLRHLDDSTRHLDQAPPVIGVTVTGQCVDVAIAADVELPEPWTLVDGAWSVEPRELTDAPHSLVSPWPSLVPVGTTPSGDPFLLNLEDVGSLAVSAPGDPDLARHIMQAMAVELAVSPISDGDLHVHLVGVAAGLPEVIDSGRLEQCDDIDELLDRLEGCRLDHEHALAADNLETAAHARRAWTSSDYTAPHIVLCAAELTETQLHRMGELTQNPRFAAAAITSQPQPAAGGWVLEATDLKSVQLHPGDGGGLALVPAPLTDADLMAVAEVLAAAQRPSAPAPAADPVDEVVRDEATSVQGETSFTGGVDVLVGASSSSERAWAAEEVEASLADTAPTPRLVDPFIETDIADEPAAAAAAPGDLASADTPVPHIWLHLLGEPEVAPLGGQKAPEGREARLTELAVLLHLEGELTHTQIDERLWPRDPHDKIADPTERARKMKDRRQQFFSRLRRWMGETSGGEEAFPKVGGRYSDVRYHLHSEVTSDWQRWCQLVPRMAYESSTDDLVEAMAMVRGTPLARHSARVTTYGWADDYRQDMISRVTDAAEELAARQITEGSVADALSTALLGLDVCTAREGLWRMAIISTHGLGGPSSREQTQQLIDRMLTEMTELEVELEPETTELLAHLDELHTDAGDPLYDISAEAS